MYAFPSGITVTLTQKMFRIGTWISSRHLVAAQHGVSPRRVGTVKTYRLSGGHGRSH